MMGPSFVAAPQRTVQMAANVATTGIGRLQGTLHVSRTCHALRISRMVGKRTSCKLVALAAAAQPSPEALASVYQVIDRAQEMEYSNQWDEAVQLLREALAGLGEGGQEGWDVGQLMLQQQISHLLFTQGDYEGALKEARAVYNGICKSVGEETGEAVLFGLRLGILEGAAGELAAGNQHIYRAGTLVAPNLQRMVAQVQELGPQGESAQLAELETAAQKLAVCLGESNYYGAIFTMKLLVEQGKAEAVVQGWDNLDAGLRHGLTNLLVALPPGTNSIRNAIREHDRLVEELGGHPELAERVKQQSVQLQKMLEEGPLMPGAAM